MNEISSFVCSPKMAPEERLIFLDEALNTISQISNQGLLILGSDSKIVWANDQSLSILGYSLAELINQEIFFLFALQDQSTIRDMLQTPILRTKLKVSSEVRVLTPLFDLKDVEVIFFSTPNLFERNQIYVLLRDISAYKSMERRLLDIHQALYKIIELGNDGIGLLVQEYGQEEIEIGCL